MITCWVEPEDWREDAVVLPREESHHLVRVLRARPGEKVRLVDGAGRQAEGPLDVADSHGARVAVRAVRTAPPAKPRRILVQAPAKGSRMDWLLEKAAEIGCDEIWPMMTARAVAKIPPGEEEKKRLRWEAVVRAACKQSGNPWCPRIALPAGFDECLARAAGRPALFGCLTEDARPLPETVRKMLADGAEEILVFIGPEGDFTEEETAKMLAAGVKPVTLGPTVLRVETAAIYTLSALAYAATDCATAQ
jgi:16S rRNA (uracil1498-N3)-methyltransferase